jgi:hypothetical protein
MRRFATSLISLAVVSALAVALSACGSSSTTTSTSTTTIDQTTTRTKTKEEPAPTTSTATPTTSTATSTSGVETTPGGAVVPKAPDCAQGEIYSPGAGACVTQGPGKNPCPQGEVPAADQPTCLPKD